MYTVKEIKEESESGISSEGEKLLSFIYICMHHRFRLCKYFWVFLLNWKLYPERILWTLLSYVWRIEPKHGFYSNDSLKDSVSSSTKLPAASKWGICYYLRLQLQGQPASQTNWDGIWNKLSTAIFSFTSFKRITFPSPPLIFIYNGSGDPWGKIQTTNDHVGGDCNHSYLASKLNLEKNAQVKH